MYGTHTSELKFPNPVQTFTSEQMTLPPRTLIAETHWESYSDAEEPPVDTQDIVAGPSLRV